MDNELCKNDMSILRYVLDDERVNRAEANNTDFDKGFREYYQLCMGAAWRRSGFTKRE